MQGALQAPQFRGSPCRFASQPFAGFMSQSAKPMLQASSEHCPFAQEPVALAKVQAAPQAPQFAMSVERLASQPFIGLPSQSPQGALQEPTPQAAILQPATPLFTGA